MKPPTIKGLPHGSAALLYASSILLAWGCARSEKSTSSDQRNTDAGTNTGGISLNVNGDASTAPTVPVTCADAEQAHSYLGCDFWPTVTMNPVWSIFDFAAVVANVGGQTAAVQVTGPTGVVATASVPAGGVSTVYLPWVPALKGPDADTCSNSGPATESSFAAKGAYHLTSTVPVIVNQFNALEFRGTGGPNEKNWSSCPGLQLCSPPMGQSYKSGCFSFSNDATILLPTSALTGNYRVTTLPTNSTQAFVAITGTQDLTTVSIKLSASANVLAGNPVPASKGGAVVQVALNAGDVVQLVATDAASDLSGSLIQANHPVQVIAGAGCAALPTMTSSGMTTSCDHIEESILPAETLGKHYIVALPTGVFGSPAPQMVRLYGNADGTTLTYPGGAPSGAPTHLDAGDVADLGVLQQDFEVVADHEISVGTFLLSAAVADPNDVVQRGDPSQTQAVTVDQFRTDYVFLAPDDYDINFVDVTMPLDAKVTLDGLALPATPKPVGGSSFGIARVHLGVGSGGAHSLVSDKPVGLQIIGYGSYTSYAYPGGLDLQLIAPPPPK
jgi:hypothetical protein